MDFTKEVCAAFPDVCVVLKAMGFFILLAIIAFIAFLIRPGYRHGRCPKCEKALKEEVFDYLIWEDGIKHTYRDFYLVCTCGYSEKENGQSELIT